jgi:hypothetical protein
MKVTLKVVDTDRYGRTVAEILRGSQNIKLQMVRRGQAFAYRQHLGNRDASTYLGAKRGAEVDRLGVWSSPGGSQRRRRTAPPATALPDGRRYSCKEIGSYARGLLRQAHTNLDSNGDGEACESLRH